MFNVGGLELVAIGLVSLVVLGPDRLPGALRHAGSLLGQLRRMSDSFRVDMTSVLTEDGPDEPRAEPRAS